VKLRLGLPKGSLQESTFNLFSRAGYRISVRERSYYPKIDDPEMEIVLMRAQEIPRYVADGALDGGISGKDWILENRAKVTPICDLVYSKGSFAVARWVIAVANDSKFKSLKHLQGKRIATELVGVTKAYLAKAGVKAEVEYSWGATEVKVPTLVDAIAEITETGASLRANGLRILDTIMETNPQVFANPQALKNPWKRKKLEHLGLLLKGALMAEEKVLLKMNVPQAKLAKILATLPALRQPTISPLADGKWSAVETVLEEKVARELIFDLKAAGAEGIIELPLNKIIP
jgi:ATP phosphoribosyltransferase